MLSLEDARRILRVSSDALDPEIQMLLDSARADMLRAGLPESVVDGDGPLVANAAACWCKAKFGYDNSEAERFQKDYRDMVCDLLNSSYEVGE
jgi:hypothetical protein